MHNERKKCIELNLRTKNIVSSRFEKSSFEQTKSNIDCSKKAFFNPRRESVFGLQITFYVFFRHPIQMKNVIQRPNQLLIYITGTYDTFKRLHGRRKRFCSILRNWYSETVEIQYGLFKQKLLSNCDQTPFWLLEHVLHML